MKEARQCMPPSPPFVQMTAWGKGWGKGKGAGKGKTREEAQAKHIRGLEKALKV